MENLLTYIKNIGFFLILMSLVCNVLPDNGFKKYCRLFLGMVLVIFVINPFSAFFNYDGNIEDIFINNTYKSKIMDIKNQLTKHEKNLNDAAYEEYREALCDYLDESVSEAGLSLVDVSVELGFAQEDDDMYIENLILYVTVNKSCGKDKARNSNINVEIDKIVIGEGKKENDINPQTLQIIHNVAGLLGIEENRIFVKIV